MFCLYILRCCDASYYVGHTDELEKRVSDHQRGGISVYTRKRRPLELVFSESFATREEALARERQVKGWSRAKKEALINGNWERLGRLARNLY
jgi:predicted GIY-YIG superfamily endonuclease